MINTEFTEDAETAQPCGICLHLLMESRICPKIKTALFNFTISLLEVNTLQGHTLKHTLYLTLNVALDLELEFRINVRICTF